MSINPEDLCMTPNCGSKKQWKGLCRSCYGQARRLIEEEKTDWDEIAELGMCEPQGKPFKVLFLKKKAERNADKQMPREDVINDIILT